MFGSEETPTNMAALKANDLALCMIREYLSRNGYQRTLEELHKETPQQVERVNRSFVISQLGVDDLVSHNKQTENHRTLLEMVSQHFINRKAKRNHQSTSTASSNAAVSNDSLPLSRQVGGSGSIASSSAVSLASISSRPAAHKLSDQKYAPPQQNQKQQKQQKQQNQQDILVEDVAWDSEITDTAVDFGFDPVTSTIGRPVNQQPHNSKNSHSHHIDQHRMITTEEAFAVRQLIFGPKPVLGHFPESWTTQGFQFAFESCAPSCSDGEIKSIVGSDIKSKSSITLGFHVSSSNLVSSNTAKPYSNSNVISTAPFFVQHEGGPCGILAAVQAELIKALWFDENASVGLNYSSGGGDSGISETSRQQALSAALSTIIWRACDGRNCVLVLPSHATASVSKRSSNHSVPSITSLGKYYSDGLTETLVVHQCHSKAILSALIDKNIASFTEKSKPGVILLLYSVILSRGVDIVRADQDEKTCTLVGAHGYCTQEMVNLLLTGRASSNVFDGVKDFGDMRMKGLTQQSDIGVLSLFEHYGSIEVGMFYKSPKYPVWVLCSESHYTTLFASPGSDLANSSVTPSRFDLFYYDQLSRQQSIIKLTVETKPASRNLNPGADDVVPPINDCIRTKWKGAMVDWNGTEPFL